MKIIETMTHDGHCNETLACDHCARKAQGQPGVQIYEPDVDSYDDDDTCTICGIVSERLEQRQAIHNCPVSPTVVWRGRRYDVVDIFLSSAMPPALRQDCKERGIDAFGAFMPPKSRKCHQAYRNASTGRWFA